MESSFYQGDEYIKELARRLAISKASIEWRRIYMYDWIFESSKLEEAREEAVAKAQAKSRAEEETRFARFTADLTAKLQAAGLPLETISSAIASSMKAAQTKA